MEDTSKTSASEAMEAVLETGLGLVVLSAEWFGKFADSVEPKLSPVRERGARLLEELKEKGRVKGSGVSKLATDAADYLREKSGLARSAEIQALREKVAALEQEVERLKAGGCGQP